MKNSVKNKAGGAVSFLISCLAACFVFFVIMLAARNIDGITGGNTLLGYSSDTGILNFFGEALELPKGVVNAILDFPRASVNFSLKFIPSCARALFVNVCTALWESFRALADYLIGAFVGFLRLGI